MSGPTSEYPIMTQRNACLYVRDRQLIKQVAYHQFNPADIIPEAMLSGQVVQEGDLHKGVQAGG